MKNTTTIYMNNIEQVIIKYNLNQSTLSKVIGVEPTTFNEKLHKKRYSKFNTEQRTKLTEYLKGLSTDINLLS